MFPPELDNLKSSLEKYFLLDEFEIIKPTYDDTFEIFHTPCISKDLVSVLKTCGYFVYHSQKIDMFYIANKAFARYMKVSIIRSL